MPDSIELLTTAVAAGDEAAVATFYRRFFDTLYRLARRATRRDESFCLDVVQEAFLRIVRSIRPVYTEAQLVAWLNLVIRATAYDLLRSERRRQTREMVFAAARETAGGGEADPGRDGDADAATLHWLRLELNRLDPGLVRIIELRFEQRWTLRRIGQLLGLSTGTIDGRLRRALLQLRRRAPRE